MLHRTCKTELDAGRDGPAQCNLVSSMVGQAVLGRCLKLRATDNIHAFTKEHTIQSIVWIVTTAMLCAIN